MDKMNYALDEYQIFFSYIPSKNRNIFSLSKYDAVSID